MFGVSICTSRRPGSAPAGGTSNARHARELERNIVIIMSSADTNAIPDASEIQFHPCSADERKRNGRRAASEPAPDPEKIGFGSCCASPTFCPPLRTPDR